MTIFKKKIVKWGLLSILLILATAGVVGYKMYTKPHRNVEEAKAVNAQAEKLVAAYESDEALANGQYLDKVLEVSGEVTEISKNQKNESVIVLKGTDMGTVRCTLSGEVSPGTRTGVQAVIKGICTGYLTDVIMVRCILEQK